MAHPKLAAVWIGGCHPWQRDQAARPGSKRNDGLARLGRRDYASPVSTSQTRRRYRARGGPARVGIRPGL